MIDRRIAKIKLRRGSDQERKTIIFPEGELIYSINSERIYVGDGQTSGGLIISNKNFIVGSMVSLPAGAEYCDIIHNITDSTTYIVGSADNGSLSAILISDVGCCKKLKSNIEEVKEGVNQIIDKFNILNPPKPPTPPPSNDTLVFIIHPNNQNTTIGNTITFTASAVGTGKITYQWFKDNPRTLITGAITNTLTITDVQIDKLGSYICQATGTVGSVDSNPAELSVDSDFILFNPDNLFLLSNPDRGYIKWNVASSNNPPVIIKHPENKSIEKFSSVTLTVVAQGSSPLSYQWYKNDILITGATDSSYTEQNLTENSIYKCLVKNNNGQVYSNPATVIVSAETNRILLGPNNDKLITNSGNYLAWKI